MHLTPLQITMERNKQLLERMLRVLALEPASKQALFKKIGIAYPTMNNFLIGKWDKLRIFSLAKIEQYIKTVEDKHDK